MAVYQEQRKGRKPVWVYNFMYNGKRYCKVAGATKEQAYRAELKKREELFEAEIGLVPMINDLTIDEFSMKYLKRCSHKKSIKRDELSVRTLLRYFQGMKLSEIKPNQIQDYILARLAKGKRGSTVNRELACLKTMFNLAIKWENARKNPVRDVEFQKEPPGRVRYLKAEEGKRLIDCAADHLKPIIIVALYTGMRLSEILTLKWSQIHINDEEHPFIELTETKNNKVRFIELNEDTISEINKLRGNGSEYVFLSDRNKPMKRITKSFHTALKKAGIDNFRFHDLRHTFASHYLMDGGDLLSLKDILGHSSIKMVDRYTHFSRIFKRKQINNMNGKFT
ncbi:MAG: site-specific integrase [Calditrichia bacterium]|nr:site-specific integrase [Calditrichota bacterium]MCB0268064.1 site-specific integrase [Calditrichota bacterium]MCB9067168.1 site-specific integrase [Calditrichia bacterium]